MARRSVTDGWPTSSRSCRCRGSSSPAPDTSDGPSPGWDVSSISASRSSTTGPSSPTRRTSPKPTRSSSGRSARALERAATSPDGYFVIVTRGHAKDAEALRAVIRREAAYLGMIGSRTKIGIMRREFLEKGWATAEEWARVRAPIGLEIGSKTVEEIAVSIAAELVQVRAGRRKKAGA
ncbi:MAG: XdhC family protein [Anaerotruncus sp.]|nr:XdhC family protein [Anaerotruncus sp.]